MLRRDRNMTNLRIRVPSIGAETLYGKSEETNHAVIPQQIWALC